MSTASTRYATPATGLPKTFTAKAKAEIKDLREAKPQLEHQIDALEKGLMRA